MKKRPLLTLTLLATVGGLLGAGTLALRHTARADAARKEAAAALKLAASRIDHMLATDPENAGQIRFDTVRTLVVPPLGVEFEVVDQDRLVWVLGAWDSTKACDPLEEHFNANTYPSAVNIPHTDYPAPNPPTSVTGQNSPTGDGYEITGTPNHPLLCLVSIAGVPTLQWRLREESKEGAFVVMVIGGGWGVGNIERSARSVASTGRPANRATWMP